MKTLIKQRGATAIQYLLGSGGLGVVVSVIFGLLSYHVVEPLTFVGQNASTIMEAEKLAVKTAIIAKCGEAQIFNLIGADGPSLCAILTTPIPGDEENPPSPAFVPLDELLALKFQACDKSASNFAICKADAKKDGRRIITIGGSKDKGPTYVQTRLVPCNDSIYKCTDD